MAIPPYTAPSRNAYDIVIIGGAVVGSPMAYWLSQDFSEYSHNQRGS